jgi:hypothetical protein
MTASSSSAAGITLRGGFVVEERVLTYLVEMEMQRDFVFELLDERRFRVSPCERLTASDVTFLRQHRDAVHRVLQYCRGDWS